MVNDNLHYIIYYDILCYRILSYVALEIDDSHLKASPFWLSFIYFNPDFAVDKNKQERTKQKTLPILSLNLQ